MARAALLVGVPGTITVRKDSRNGTWRACVYVRDSTGERREISRWGHTKGAAEQTLRQAIATLTPRESTREGMTVTALKDRWLDQHKDKVEPSTWAKYEERVRIHIVPKLGGRLVSEVTPILLDDFIKELSSKYTTVARNCRTHLVQAFDLAVHSRWIEATPMTGVRRVAPAGKGEIVTYTDEQVAELLDLVWTVQVGDDPEAVSPLWCITVLCMTTGARIGEALALQWQDIDLDSATPSVHVHKTVADGKGGATYVKETTKTGEDGERRIWIPDIAVTALEIMRTLSSGNPEAFVFACPDGQIMRRQNLDAQMRRVVRGTALEPFTGFHTMRRTVGTKIANSHSLAAAAQQLGHADESTTRRHYQKHSVETQNLTQTLAFEAAIPATLRDPQSGE